MCSLKLKDMMTVKKESSCADDYDPQALSVSSALNQILKLATPLSDSEVVPLKEALGRILADDLSSSVAVPGYDNSAMDGYALHFSDLESHVPLKVIGTVYAGHAFEGTLKRGQCLRIMTGGIIPDGADTVVIQEHVASHNGSIEVAVDSYKKGQNIRRKGEDIAVDDVVLKRGRKLSPADLGLMASLGIERVSVVRRLKVGFFTTGDELRSVGNILKKGEIYDSNRYTLFGMLERLGLIVTDFGIVRDQVDELTTAFKKAARDHDVVVTSGGVSVGEADYSKQVLETLGQIHLWKIAMKPGRPLAFGSIGKALYFGLPGNPVSVMTTFYIFVQPALQKMSGEKTPSLLKLTAKCCSKLRKRRGRTEFQRGVLQISNDGVLTVTSTGSQGSGILSSISKANCFIVLSDETQSVEVGSSVTVVPFVGFA